MERLMRVVPSSQVFSPFITVLLKDSALGLLDTVKIQVLLQRTRMKRYVLLPPPLPSLLGEV